jgi:hypothetical protein
MLTINVFRDILLVYFPAEKPPCSRFIRNPIPDFSNNRSHHDLVTPPARWAHLGNYGTADMDYTCPMYGMCVSLGKKDGHGVSFLSCSANYSSICTKLSMYVKYNNMSCRHVLPYTEQHRKESERQSPLAPRNFTSV